jgi:hypothetical protein
MMVKDKVAAKYVQPYVLDLCQHSIIGTTLVHTMYSSIHECLSQQKHFLTKAQIDP